jgi:GntR family transcriptional regulator, transcriptional repressor for pyruvate dehydrogenase complex
MIAGMRHEISERHTTTTTFLGVRNVVDKAQYEKLIRSYTHLVDLVVARGRRRGRGALA